MMQIRVPLYNAVVGKELRTRVRGWSSLVLITLYMVVFGLIAGGFLILQAGTTIGQASQVGVKLFTALAGLQLVLIMLITPSTTAGAISGERQRQTWDLLIITRLSTAGIVWGKLVSGVAFQILLMFAALPIFSLVFLFGGVSPSDIFHVYLVSVVTALYLGSMSIFISSLTRRMAGSIIIANLATLVLTVGLTAFTIFVAYEDRSPYTGTTHALTPLAQFDPLIGMLSALPNFNGTGPYLVNQNWVHHSFIFFGTIPMWDAYTIVAILTSCVFLGLAAFFARSRVRWLTRGPS